MLEPFAGWLVDPRFARQVVIPPYDAMTAADRRSILDSNPDSYLHAILDPVDHPGPDRLAVSRAAIDRLVAERMSPRLPSSYYAYRLTQDGESMTGLVGLITYSNLRWTSVLGHEAVQPTRVKLLADYLMEVGASSSPAAMAVRDDAALINSLAAITRLPPDLRVQAGDDAIQEVWAIEPSETMRSLVEAFDPIYIIDGHHRISAAVAVKEVPILGVVFPASELSVGAFHRVLDPLGAVERADLAGKLESAQRLDGPRPPRHGNIVVYIDGVWWELAVRVPEVLALHEDVIPHVDPKTDLRLTYVPDGGLGSVGSEAAVFLLPPMDLNLVLDVATSGGTLPSKATRFYPKARSGVFLSRP